MNQHLTTLNCLIVYLLGFYSLTVSCDRVLVFHLIDNALWGETDGSALEGTFDCNMGPSFCTFVSTDTVPSVDGSNLVQNLRQKFLKYVNSMKDKSTVQEDPLFVALYNIHTWRTLSKGPHYPDICILPTNISIVESEESHQRFHRLFLNSFQGFDGNSTTHPSSSIQRSYIREFGSSPLLPVFPYNQKVKAAAFVASTCHNNRGRTSIRESIVRELSKSIRIDSLGKCKVSSKIHNDTVDLKFGKNADETLALKRHALSRYLFYLAFENTIEPGYVTEKVFDALKSGSVPIYLGASTQCRKMMPSNHSVIYVDDYINKDNGILQLQKLVQYINKLMFDKIEYDKFLAWRKSFTLEQQYRGELSTGKDTWPCKICKWAFENRHKMKQKRIKCSD